MFWVIRNNEVALLGTKMNKKVKKKKKRKGYFFHVWNAVLSTLNLVIRLNFNWPRHAHARILV